MSRDDPDAEATVDFLDEDALAEEILDDSDLEPPVEELEAEELGVSALEDSDIDDDGLGDLPLDDSDGDDDSGDDDDTPATREIPAGVRPCEDEDEDDDDDDDDDELEADLGEILKERLASEDEEENDDDDDIGIVAGTRSTSKQEDEILCEGCFLLVKPSQFEPRSTEPTCPHCGTPIVV